jgi:hypothetical protein
LFPREPHRVAQPAFVNELAALLADRGIDVDRVRLGRVPQAA